MENTFLFLLPGVRSEDIELSINKDSKNQFKNIIQRVTNQDRKPLDNLDSIPPMSTPLLTGAIEHITTHTQEQALKCALICTNKWVIYENQFQEN